MDGWIYSSSIKPTETVLVMMLCNNARSARLWTPRFVGEKNTEEGKIVSCETLHRCRESSLWLL